MRPDEMRAESQRQDDLGLASKHPEGVILGATLGAMWKAAAEITERQDKQTALLERIAEAVERQSERCGHASESGRVCSLPTGHSGFHISDSKHFWGPANMPASRGGGE